MKPRKNRPQVPDPAVIDLLTTAINREVRIEWKNPANNWLFFRVLNVRCNGGKMGPRVRLKGSRDPETNVAHIGDEFWCVVAGIRAVTILK